MMEIPPLASVATPVPALFAAGQYEAVATLCEQGISHDPTQLDFYWYLGIVRLFQGDLEEAQATWFAATTVTDAITVTAGLADLFHLLLKEADRQLLSRPDLAMQLCGCALDLNSDAPDVYLLLGQALALQGRLDEAIEHWQQTVELQPDRVEAYCLQGEVWQKLEQWEEAIDAYSAALALRSNWQVHYNLGLCLAQQQRWQKATWQFDQVISLQPTYAAAYGDRGWMKLQQGHWQDALVDFDQAVRQQSNFAPIYQQWVAALSDSVRSPAMLENSAFLEALSTQGATVETYRAFAKLVARRSDAANRVSDSNDAAHENLAHTTLSAASELPSPAKAIPIGFYETTQDWAEQIATAGRYISLDSPSWLELAPPQTIDPSLHFSFRFERNIPLPGTFVAQIPQGRAWLSDDQTSQAILTAENQLLGDLSAEFPLLSPGHPDKKVSHHTLFSRQTLPPLHYIPGKIAVLAGLTNDMYFHWMFDVLPRLDLLHRSSIDLREIDGFLVSDRLPFQQETLARLGIPQSKILATEQHLHLQATELIVPSYPSTPAWMAAWVCDWLRRVFLSPELASARQNATLQQGCDRLYISRAKTANRRVINEAELIEFLSQFGFQSVTLETLSVQEQASLLSRAKVVISPHGGGLTNTVFCQPGTKIIELFSPHYVYPCYWLISNLLHLDYFYLTGIMPEGMYLSRLFYPDVRLADMLIDLQQLQAILNLAGVR